MSAVVRPVASPADTVKFIKSQWNFYKNDPHWVAPIVADRKKLLDTKKNPFYRHSAMQLFLAEDNGTVVGRIAAIVNDNHNKIHNDKVGFFGFFECVDDQKVADALFAAAAEWLKKKGMTEMRGPANPSMNDECGLLVDGFNMPPVVLMTYNPPYYARLIEKAGLSKIKDLYAYLLKQEDYRSEKLQRLNNAIRQRNKLTVREVDFKNKEQFRKDIHTIKDLYNSAWQPNWGFVKMTDEEFDFLAKDLKQIADQRYTIIAESDGKPVGFMLALPDINQSLIYHKSGGLLGAVWHLLTKKKKINTLRIIVLGVLPQYQGRGIDAVLYDEAGARGLPYGITQGEASWILEDNVEMNHALQHAMHGTLYKTYRMYQKAL